MRDYEAYKLENRCPGVRSISSDDEDLKYFVDSEERGVVIAGIKGRAGLTVKQAKAVCRELPEILRGMGYSLNVG